LLNDFNLLGADIGLYGAQPVRDAMERVTDTMQGISKQARRGSPSVPFEHRLRRAFSASSGEFSEARFAAIAVMRVDVEREPPDDG
jgi:hypothetical protein